MILYHGTNLDIERIDLSKCKPYKDFGQGFYLTELKEQAVRMAQNVTAIYGGFPIINVYEFDENLLLSSELRVRKVPAVPTVEWAQFIVNNRSRIFTDFNNIECNIDLKYDIVIGPVADDKIAATIRRYMGDKLDIEGLKKQLTYRELTNQYSFHTDKAVACLKKEGVLFE